MYGDWAKEKQILNLATERQYRDVLNAEFNIGFFQPKKDKCEICVEYEQKENKTQELEEFYKKHNNRKNFVRKLMENDNMALKCNELCVSLSDLQKVIEIPQSRTSVFYYKYQYLKNRVPETYRYFY